jgi:hypothetical protein
MTSTAPKPNNTDKPASPPKQEPTKVTGSPATAGTKDNNKGEGGTKATEGNKSPTTVASGTTDNSPATGQGGHANVAGATQDPKDPNVVKPEDVSGKPQPLDLTGGPTSVNDEFVKALNEPDVTEVSEAELDAFDRKENGATLEELKQQREDLDRKIGEASRGHEKPTETVSRQQREHDEKELNDAFNKLVKIDSVVQATTPDSHIAWGVGGVTLTLGDIRKIARAYVKNGSRV